MLYGTVDAVDGSSAASAPSGPGGGTPAVIATGGLAPVVAPHVHDHSRVDPELTLQGLRFAAGHLGLRW